MLKTKAFAIMVAAAAVGLGACDEDDTTAPQPGTIVEVARAAGSFNTLLAALDAAGLTATLEGNGPFTVSGCGN